MISGTITLKKDYDKGKERKDHLFSKFICSTRFIEEKKNFTEIYITLRSNPEKDMQLPSNLFKTYNF